jgi:hypothetical protein
MLRERFSIYPDATCPAGTVKDLASAPMASVLICIGTAGVKSSGVCPAGATPMFIMNDARDTDVVCVPTSTASYPRLEVDPTSFPCNAGDYLGFTETSIKCIPSGAAATTTPPPSSGGSPNEPPATTTTPAPSSGGSLDELSARLTSLRAQYTTLASQATSTPAQVPTLLPQIQSINQQIAGVLDQMLTQMQYARQGPNSEAYRDELTATLARIQMDYNGLKTNTDALQTLKRIRSFQDTSWQPMMNLYIGLFLLFGIILVLVMVFRRQTNASTPATIASPPAMPTLI